MRCFAVILVLLVSCQPKPAPKVVKEEPPSWAPPYSYAKAYLYGIDDSRVFHIVYDGKLDPSVVDTNGVKLSEQAAKKVELVASGKLGENEDLVQECFIPHHGVVFYNSKNKPVAWVSMCFMCNTMHVEPENGLPDRGMPELRKIIKECGLPIFKRQEQYLEYVKSLKEEVS